MPFRPDIIFDAHFHVFDPRFPLVPNQGYLPDRYTVSDYRERTKEYNVRGGAVVSGSFQAFDQDYLVDALSRLGPGFVGVTQLPASVSDEELIELNDSGIRGVRFNVQRGGSENICHLDTLARRVHEIVGWHTELYADAGELDEQMPILMALPAVSIDHLGLSLSGFSNLLKLAERGARIKATGFGRVDFDVGNALKDLYSANPDCLMFGTDLPSTRASRPYTDRDLQLIVESLGEQAAARVFWSNAARFYRVED
jgi:predicted TIM-barrel fold metal-dependent hydrolase